MPLEKVVANRNPTGYRNSSNSVEYKEVVLKAHAALLSIVGQLVSSVWDAVAARTRLAFLVRPRTSFAAKQARQRRGGVGRGFREGLADQLRDRGG